MFLELTLAKDDDNFGPFGTKVMINDAYIVGVTGSETGSKVLIDMSDLEKYKSIHVSEPYSKWRILRLNP